MNTNHNTPAGIWITICILISYCTYAQNVEFQPEAPKSLLSNSTAFPGKLNSFTSDCRNDKVLLNWTTASERNCDYFVLERSEDGMTFSLLGTVKCIGTSSSGSNYSFTDNEPIAGRSYYRLSQTGYNGNSESFDPIVNDCKHNLGFLFYVYPVIVMDEKISIHVASTQKEKISIVVSNAFGEELYTTILPEGNSSFMSIDMEGRLNAGVYFVTAVSANQRISKKVVVVK
ncbi:MAG TPA: T9SS type A sorting domain-containing protein [Bacteroidia bacterium]